MRRRTGDCRETRLTLVAGGTCASPRLRQSLAALGSVYGLNEKQISSSPVPQCLREKSSSDSHPAGRTFHFPSGLSSSAGSSTRSPKIEVLIIAIINIANCLVGLNSANMNGNIEQQLINIV